MPTCLPDSYANECEAMQTYDTIEMYFNAHRTQLIMGFLYSKFIFMGVWSDQYSFMQVFKYFSIVVSISK